MLTATRNFLDGVPIVGHVKSMIYYYQGQKELAVNAFISATHNTGVTCLGVLGRALTDPPESFIDIVAGPVAGGIIGGICVDALISILTFECYGYIHIGKKMITRKMNDDDRLAVRNVTFKDTIIALSVFSVYSIAIKFLSFINKHKETDFDILLNTVETDHDEHDTAIKCKLDACEKLVVISKDGDLRDLRDFRNVLALFFPNWKRADKIQVNSISQIQSGDHIVYERVIIGGTHLYDHHAIVGEVFPEKGKYTAYEQSTPPNTGESKATGKASIREIEKRFDTKSLYKINHRRTGISNDEVKKMAHYICHHATQIDFIKKYNLIFNNCEHFANFCATGQRESFQIQQFVLIEFIRDIWGLFHFMYLGWYYQFIILWYFLRNFFSVIKSLVRIMFIFLKGLVNYIFHKK